MNDELNNGFKYDKSRLNEMQRFLNHIHTIARSNPNLDITSSIVYNELKNWNLKSSDRDEYRRPRKVDDLFPVWINGFKGTENIGVFVSENFKYWC